MFLFLPSELLDCDDLHSVIRLVLKAGNYMNAVGISLIMILLLFFDKWLDDLFVVAGEPQRQCHRLQDVLAAQPG